MVWPDTDVRAQSTRFSLNDTSWHDLLFGALALYLFWTDHRHPMDHGQHSSGHHNRAGHRADPTPAST